MSMMEKEWSKKFEGICKEMIIIIDFGFYIG